MSSLFLSNLAQHIALFQSLGGLSASIEAAGEQVVRSLSGDGKLLLCGNGGSAADCQHIAAELTGRFIHDRRPLAAISLTTDTSALTCIANDYSYDEVFSRQVNALARSGDCLIGISTSGNSANVIKAVEAAKKLGVTTIGLLGRDGGKLASLCDYTIIVPSNITARIQEAHILIGHTLCGQIEQSLGLVPQEF